MEVVEDHLVFVVVGHGPAVLQEFGDQDGGQVYHLDVHLECSVLDRLLVAPDFYGELDLVVLG